MLRDMFLDYDKTIDIYTFSYQIMVLLINPQVKTKLLKRLMLEKIRVTLTLGFLVHILSLQFVKMFVLFQLTTVSTTTYYKRFL